MASQAMMGEEEGARSIASQAMMAKEEGDGARSIASQAMMGKEGEVGARSLPAMRGRKRSQPEEKEISEEPACRRRSARLMRMKELAEMDRRLKLKREIDELEDLETERMKAYKRYRFAVCGLPYIEPPKKEKRRKKKKVVTREVPLKLIEHYIRNPYNPMPDYSELRLEERNQTFRELMVVKKAIADKMLEYEKSIIKQFHTNGKAYDYHEVEVDDGDDEEEKKDVKEEEDDEEN